MNIDILITILISLNLNFICKASSKITHLKVKLNIFETSAKKSSTKITRTVLMKTLRLKKL